MSAPQDGGAGDELLELADCAASIGLELTEQADWKCEGCYTRADSVLSKDGSWWPPTEFPHSPDCPSLVIPRLLPYYRALSGIADPEGWVRDVTRELEALIDLHHRFSTAQHDKLGNLRECSAGSCSRVSALLARKAGR